MRLEWLINSAELELSNGDTLQTDIIVSLFTDCRARDDDMLPDESNNRRGCWYDSFRTQPMGSRLWLLHREKQLTVVLRRAAEYARESLQWLINAGRVHAIAVTATNPHLGVLQLTVVVTLHNQRVEYLFNADLNEV